MISENPEIRFGKKSFVSISRNESHIRSHLKLAYWLNDFIACLWLAEYLLCLMIGLLEYQMSLRRHNNCLHEKPLIIFLYLRRWRLWIRRWIWPWRRRSRRTWRRRSAWTGARSWRWRRTRAWSFRRHFARLLKNLTYNRNKNEHWLKTYDSSKIETWYSWFFEIHSKNFLRFFDCLWQIQGTDSLHIRD